MKRTVLGAIVVAAFLTGQAGAVIIYNDGLVHEINSTVYEDIRVYDGPSGGPTLMRLVAGAATYDVDVFQNSLFEMTEGEIEDGTLGLHDSSVGEISGGSISDDGVQIFDFSRLIITGGEIDAGFRCYGDSEIIIHGSNFQIDDVPIGYGRVPVPMGLLSGDLLDGQTHSYTFLTLGDSSVTLVPEPGTLLLVGLGGLGFLRRHGR